MGGAFGAKFFGKVGKPIEFSPLISAVFDSNDTSILDDTYDMVSKTPQIPAKISFDDKTTINSIAFLIDSSASLRVFRRVYSTS